MDVDMAAFLITAIAFSFGWWGSRGVAGTWQILMSETHPVSPGSGFLETILLGRDWPGRLLRMMIAKQRTLVQCCHANVSDAKHTWKLTHWVFQCLTPVARSSTSERVSPSPVLSHLTVRRPGRWVWNLWEAEAGLQSKIMDPFHTTLQALSDPGLEYAYCVAESMWGTGDIEKINLLSLLRTA